MVEDLPEDFLLETDGRLLAIRQSLACQSVLESTEVSRVAVLDDDEQDCLVSGRATESQGVLQVDLK